MNLSMAQIGLVLVLIAALLQCASSRETLEVLTLPVQVKSRFHQDTTAKLDTDVKATEARSPDGTGMLTDLGDEMEEAAGTKECDPSLVRRRRRQAKCSCRRRTGLADLPKGWTCDKNTGNEKDTIRVVPKTEAKDTEEAKAAAAKEANDAEKEKAATAKEVNEEEESAPTPATDEKAKAATAKEVNEEEENASTPATSVAATENAAAPPETQSIALDPMSVKLDVDKECSYIAHVGYPKRSCDQWGSTTKLSISQRRRSYFSNTNFVISGESTWPLTGAKKEGIAFRIDKVPDIKATAPGSFSSPNLENPNLKVPVCSAFLTVNASDSQMSFEAVELQLNMTRRGFICKNADDDMSVRVQTPTEDNSWTNYPQTYTCKDTSCSMKFPSTSMLKATRFRLVMRCSSSGKTCDDNYLCKLSQNDCYGRDPPAWHSGFKKNCMDSESPCPGFADTATQNEVSIKMITKAGSFGWDDAVRSAIASEIAAHGQFNLCPKVMNNSIVLKHFQQWATPASGEFKQEPDPTKLPVSMNVTGVKWDVIAMKKHLAEPGEGIFHKYMLCFQKSSADEVCCVVKGVDTSPQTTVSNLAQARLKAL